MSQQEKTSKPYSASFTGALANVLFDTPANPDRDAEEQRVVVRLENFLSRASKKQIWIMALFIDETIIPLLSGRNLLLAARLIEDRAEAVITQMRNLRSHKEHLERTAEMAEILSPGALDKLILAVKQSTAEKV